MNYNTLSPSAKTCKKAQMFSTGQMMTDSEVFHIGIINATEGNNGDHVTKNIMAGTRSKGAASTMFSTPRFGFLNQTSPLSMKFTDSFRNLSAANADAIIQSNKLSGVVIVSDCPITASGLLIGCIRTNTPAMVLSLGVNQNLCVSAFQEVGRIATGASTQEAQDTIIKRSASYSGHPDFLSACSTTFFRALEIIGLSPKGSSNFIMNGGEILQTSYDIGAKIVKMSKELDSPRRYFTKDSLANLGKTLIPQGASVGGLHNIVKLMNACDVKVSHTYWTDFAKDGNNLILVKGGACEDGGFVQPLEDTPISISGRAWVYQNIEDADQAISNGTVTEGVIVLQNCAGMYVSCIKWIIEGMGLSDKIAIVTDGMCGPSNVLCVTMCRPTAMENEAFANIQTGDVLEIDLAKGRLNTSIPSKDMKIRAKRGTIKKPTEYFV